MRQFKFRSVYSAEDAVPCLNVTVKRTIDQNKVAIAAYFDLSKASKILTPSPLLIIKKVIEMELNSSNSVGRLNHSLESGIQYKRKQRKIGKIIGSSIAYLPINELKLQASKIQLCIIVANCLKNLQDTAFESGFELKN